MLEILILMTKIEADKGLRNIAIQMACMDYISLLNKIANKLQQIKYRKCQTITLVVFLVQIKGPGLL